MPHSNDRSDGPWRPKILNNSNNNSNDRPPFDLDAIIRWVKDILYRIPSFNIYGPFYVLFLLIFLFCAIESIYIVHPDERGVELRFGRPKDEIMLPGLHVMLWPIDQVEIVKVIERQQNIGKPSTAHSHNGLILTGDQNIVSLQFSVLYVVTDPRSYLFNLESPGETLRQVSESAIREVVGRRFAVDIFRSQRQQISLEVRDVIQKTMDYYKSGILINTISIEDVSPPREVADAFDEVQRAEQDEDRFVEESNKYSNRVLGSSRGEASRIRESSIAYRDRVIQEAQGEADRFLSIYGQYSHAPALLRKRIYLETMEDILKKTKKIIIDKKQGIMPYFPLNKVFSRVTKKKESGGINDE
ncbi:FtsH protease activity modulator HflK [Candidatus Liberibacter africanus]|uniref:Protein HflK n=1 Tax=Candidatus Liberibacter africanus PTSAPSY TaxID=1277257 RepID=A0A0G3I3Y9_LIBAF|nr:FtsH protease activity modulator HflK [Candidatus Liberibacter africanus]AKK20601.1 HflK protein [Candidatus Liberibacter africanus PTSAPSY]QTP64287.1 FtsH protease activity modulator HflK [Candidatus Liberibacter africanus]